MVIVDEMMARKYAVAFCNVYGDQLTHDFIHHLRAFASVIALRRGILVYLMLKTLSHDQKEAMIERLMQHYSLSIPFRHLVVMLYRHRRLALLSLIIRKITKIYWKRHSVELVTVTTSHALQDEQKRRIVAFVQQCAQVKAIKADFSVVPDLISGIRIKGDAWIWERSIRAVLRDVKRDMLQRVGL
jgi:ATP synthase F1 delta subunit